MAISLYKIKKWGKMFLGNSALHVIQNEGKCWSKEEIKGYYNNLTEKITRFGFPHGTIPTYPNENGEIIEFSIGIFQYGLAAYDLFLLNNDHAMLKDAIMCAEWAITNQKTNGAWDTFSKEYPDHPYSAMAQGEAISLLARCYQHNSKSEYISAIKKAKDFLLTSDADGGVSRYTKNGDLYLLEFTFREPILNGWIFALWGLFDYMKLFPDDTEVQKKLQLTTETLSNALPSYDVGYWSTYNLDKTIISSPFYHRLHIHQLKVMGDITGNKRFYDFSNKWEIYDHKFIYRKLALIHKILQKLKE